MQLVKKLKLTRWSKVYLKIHHELLKNYKQSLLDWPWQYHDMSIIKNLWIDLEHAVCARQSKKYVRGWTELQGRVLKISNFRIGRFLAWLKKIVWILQAFHVLFFTPKVKKSTVWLKFCINFQQVNYIHSPASSLGTPVQLVVDANILSVSQMGETYICIHGCIHGQDDWQKFNQVSERKKDDPSYFSHGTFVGASRIDLRKCWLLTLC